MAVIKRLHTIGRTFEGKGFSGNNFSRSCKDEEEEECNYPTLHGALL